MTAQDPILRANLPWLRRMLEVDDAEARGDAAAALALMDDMPTGPDGRPWWRPERVRRLRQLVELGAATPLWVWDRWIVAQAAQSTHVRPPEAIEIAIETRGGACTLWGVDDADAKAKVIDHDWVYRQVVLHEHGGLRGFVSDRAEGTLLDRAGRVGAWSDVPMGAYELVAERSDRITWRDMGTGANVATLNLGGASLMAIGEAAIGRVVQSGGAALFESAPLWVPREVARDVAAAPARWIDALALGCRNETYGPELCELIAKLHHFDLLCDLPARVRRHLVQPADPGLRSDRVGTGGNGGEYDVALVLGALSGEIPLAESPELCAVSPDDARPLGALVAAALLEPGTVEALGRLLVASDAARLVALAEDVASPADEVCRRLARGLATAA